MIGTDSDKAYPSEYGQPLLLSDNQRITLTEKHVRHRIKAIIRDDKAGLEVVTRTDRRSFGEDVKEEAYFISVRDEE